MWLPQVPLSVSQERAKGSMATIGDVPPDIKRQFKASYEDTLPNLPGTVTEGMLSCCLSDKSETESLVEHLLASIAVQAPVFLPVIVRRIVFVESWRMKLGVAPRHLSGVGMLTLHMTELK